MKTCDRSLLVCKEAMPGVIASAWLLLIRKTFLEIKAQMIKETFLHSEPNLCFWCADATSKKSSIFKNILYNITCMTQT